MQCKSGVGLSLWQQRPPCAVSVASRCGGRPRQHAGVRRALQEQQQQVPVLETPEECAQQILLSWEARNLEALLPYMSEIAVIKAVVRQHHAKVAEQKQCDRRRQQQEQQQQRQPPCSGGGGDGAAAATAAATSSSSTTSSYDTIAPYEAAHTVQHWSQVPYSPQPPQPRPPCPVPGANSSHSRSHDYADEYAAFNYAHRFAQAPPRVREAAASTAPSGHAPPDSVLHSSAQHSAGEAAGQAAGHAAGQAPDFLAVLDAAQAGGGASQLLDSFAMRHLVLSRPASLAPLSTMRLGPGLFVLRARSTSLWGEKCVLTFTLKRRSEQEQQSTYSKHPHKQPWMLTKVVGEACSAEPLEAISPDHPPEAVVAAQLTALKECDFDVAYALTSPVGRAVAGTRDRFRAALQADFRYQPVIMHAAATSVHRTHSNANTYLEVFDVTGQPGTGSSLFIWVATRQLEGLYKNCWMVEYVTPIRDESVIKALQIGL